MFPLSKYITRKLCLSIVGLQASDCFTKIGMLLPISALFYLKIMPASAKPDGGFEI